LFTVDSGFPSLDEGSNISIHSDLSRGSVDSYLPSFYEGGSTSVAPLSSVRDISPSELQVFISREKPEIISDFFASHSSVMQSGSSGVVSGSQVSHFDSVQLNQSAAVEVSPLTRTQSFLILKLFRCSLNLLLGVRPLFRTRPLLLAVCQTLFL